jgi:hypothetical protein
VFLQFVEIKGSVFKKFEKKNLYQISCSDVRERFQFIVLLLMVIIRNMTELGWKMGLSFCPDTGATLFFFNSLPYFFHNLYAINAI